MALDNINISVDTTAYASPRESSPLSRSGYSHTRSNSGGGFIEGQRFRAEERLDKRLREKGVFDLLATVMNRAK